GLRRKYQDPSFRAQRIAHLQRLFSDPVRAASRSAKHSARLRRQWQDPVYRAKMLAHLEKLSQHPVSIKRPGRYVRNLIHRVNQSELVRSQPRGADGRIRSSLTAKIEALERRIAKDEAIFDSLDIEGKRAALQRQIEVAELYKEQVQE